MELFNMGALEIIFLLGLAVIVLGPQKAVELASQAGRLIANLRRNLNLLQADLRSQLEEENRALQETRQLLQDVGKEIKAIEETPSVGGEKHNGITAHAETGTPPSDPAPEGGAQRSDNS